MKKAVTILFLLTLCLANSYCQWYESKYNVTDINYLTKAQLEKELKETRSLVFGSLVFAGLGVGMILIRHNLEDEEDPTLFEQLVGDKGMRVIKNGAGIVFAGAGTIACFYFLGRLGTIRSTLNKNFQSYGSINLTPTIVLKQNSRSLYPGLTLTYSF